MCSQSVSEKLSYDLHRSLPWGHVIHDKFPSIMPEKGNAVSLYMQLFVRPSIIVTADWIEVIMFEALRHSHLLSKGVLSGATDAGGWS